MEEVKKKIAELDGKIVKLNKLVEQAKKEKVAQDQDVSRRGGLVRRAGDGQRPMED